MNRPLSSTRTLTKGRRLSLRDELCIILQILISEKYDFSWNKEARCIEGGKMGDWEGYLKSNPKDKRFQTRQYTIFDGMMMLCTTADPTTGDHKFRASGKGGVLRKVTLPAAKYQAPIGGRTSRHCRDGARLARRSDRSALPRRHARSRSVECRRKRGCDASDSIRQSTELPLELIFLSLGRGAQLPRQERRSLRINER